MYFSLSTRQNLVFHHFFIVPFFGGRAYCGFGHRLDKETSGPLVHFLLSVIQTSIFCTIIIKVMCGSFEAREALVKQWANVQKEYICTI